jgi:hypothetical protein
LAYCRPLTVMLWPIQRLDRVRREGLGPLDLAGSPQELIKDIKPALKKVFKDEFSGTADLYVYFYVRALQVLAPGGIREATFS